MSFESAVICLDNSVWMINGDYDPLQTRYICQLESAELLAKRIIDRHTESSVGMLLMAGDGDKSLLTSPTRDLNLLGTCTRNVELKGQSNVVNAIHVALLVLKFRKNKAGSQRVILYVGSPINDSIENLVKIGKVLNKNNVCIDIISFGSIDSNEALLASLFETVSKNKPSDHVCNLVKVPIGSGLTFADLVSSSLIGSQVGGAGQSISGSDRYSDDLDDQLQMVLRMSADEHARGEKERVAKAGGVEGSGDSGKGGNDGGISVTSGSTSSGNSSSVGSFIASASMDVEFDDDDDLQRAIKMSLLDSPHNSSVSIRDSANEIMIEDDLVARAISMTSSATPAVLTNSNIDQQAPKKLKLEQVSNASAGSPPVEEKELHYDTPRQFSSIGSPPLRPAKTPNPSVCLDGVSSHRAHIGSDNLNSSQDADVQFYKQLLNKVNVNPDDITLKSTIDHLSSKNIDDDNSLGASIHNEQLVEDSPCSKSDLTESENRKRKDRK